MTDETSPAGGPMDRRQFVKTSVGIAAAGAIGATTAGLVVPLSTARLTIKRFPYWGAKKVGGPAPQGIPLLPVRVNAEGFIEGAPELANAPLPYSLDWYKYCAHEGAPGLNVDFTDDNVLRYFNNPAKLKRAASELGGPIWYDAAGYVTEDKDQNERVMAKHFTEIDMGAPFWWRSEGEEQTNIVTGIVIRVDPSRMSGLDASPFLAKVKLEGGTATPATGDDYTHAFVAFCSFCAHFCCVPGYKESAIPLKKNLFDKIYCTCHDSVYDPYQIKKYTFPPDF